MIVLLEKQDKEVINELLEKLIINKKRVLATTPSSGASDDLEKYNQVLKAKGTGIKYINVYGRTWNMYMPEDLTSQFRAFTEEEFDAYISSIAVDNNNNNLYPGNLVVTYFEDSGVNYSTIISITNKGIKLNTNTGEKYILKEHCHRIIKI